jgi:predicted DsbA family dithiol-disulfide isomerase
MAREDGLRYTPWPHRDHYPNWSLPALEAAKCAERQGPEAFERLHLALYRAFFTESRDIARPDEIVTIAAESGLDPERFLADYRAGHGRQAVIADYRAAVEDGVNSIPTVVVPDTGRVLVGLAEVSAYRAAVEEALR